MEMVLWNMVLTGIVALLGFVVKDKFAELNRLGILLNRTREEMAKEYVTKQEVHADINRIVQRLDAMDAKIDRLIERISK